MPTKTTRHAATAPPAAAPLPLPPPPAPPPPLPERPVAPPLLVVRNGLFAKTTDCGLKDVEREPAGSCSVDAILVVSAAKTLLEGLSAVRVDCIATAFASEGVFPMSTETDTETPSDPAAAGPPGSRRALMASWRRLAGTTHAPVAMSEMFETETAATLETPRRLAKAVVMDVRMSREPARSEGRSRVFLATTLKAKPTRTFGTLLGEGDCEGVGVLLDVGVCEEVGLEVGVALSELVVDGVALRLEVLVVEMVGEMLIDAVREMVAVGERDGPALCEAVELLVGVPVGVGVLLGVGEFEGVGGMQALPAVRTIFGEVEVEPPLKDHELSRTLLVHVRGLPKNPEAHVQTYCDAPANATGVTAFESAGSGGCESTSTSCALRARVYSRTSSTYPLKGSWLTLVSTPPPITIAELPPAPLLPVATAKPAGCEATRAPSR